MNLLPEAWEPIDPKREAIEIDKTDLVHPEPSIIYRGTGGSRGRIVSLLEIFLRFANPALYAAIQHSLSDERLMLNSGAMVVVSETRWLQNRF